MLRARALQARSVLGVSLGVSLGAFGPLAPECPKKCPESVPGVSESCPGHSGDTLGTLFGHSGAQGPKGPRDIPRTLPGHFGPKGPRHSCSRSGGGCNKRVVLANVPSFRFSFRGNMRTYPRSGFRSVGFRSGGTSATTTVLENHPFLDPRTAEGHQEKELESANGRGRLGERPLRLRTTQESCGGLQGEKPGALPQNGVGKRG